MTVADVSEPPPLTVSVPPKLTVVPLAEPPLSTIWMPLSTVVEADEPPTSDQPTCKTLSTIVPIATEDVLLAAAQDGAGRRTIVELEAAGLDRRSAVDASGLDRGGGLLASPINSSPPPLDDRSRSPSRRPRRPARRRCRPSCRSPTPYTSCSPPLRTRPSPARAVYRIVFDDLQAARVDGRARRRAVDVLLAVGQRTVAR